MKQMTLLIAALFFCWLQGLLSQDHTLPEDCIPGEPLCSHQAKYFMESGGKSVINPNPHVFDYDVKFYKLDLEAYDSTNQFTGSATVFVQITVPVTDTFSIELSNKLSADSVYINGIWHSFTHISNNIYVPLPAPVAQGDYIEFLLYYHTPPTYNSIYFSSTLDPNWGNFVVAQTFSEPYFAHEFMPCKQELGDKADSVFIFITTNNDVKVAGPGLLTVVPLPDLKARYEWRSHLKTAFYLIFFAISDYQEYTIYAKPDSLPGDSVMVLNYVYDYPNCLQNNKATIDKTTAMIELFSDKMGLFPFHDEKYGHYMWYISSFSGMEHITMMGIRSFSENLVAHELAHSWFGDNVTCATWSDIWINEGFASYGEYIERQYMISQASADALMLSYMNYVMTSPGGSVYVPPANLNNWGRIFSTRLTYRKGCSLVHMIRFQMNNDSLFFRTLYEFQQQFTDSLATGLDFKTVCENVSGIDFTSFFNQWYFGEGYPTFSVIWSQAADTVWLNSIQTTSTVVTTLFKTPIEFKLTYSGGSQTFRLTQLTNDTTFKIVIPHVVTGITIDPNNWILNQAGTIIQG
ncbi:MAG: M1 family metallopeptidase, partial [Bacteroidetes bacterium]|nr:M1 family metallopeptidase [Bacteroidota bacterium]